MAREKQHNLFQPEDFPDPLPAWEIADQSDVICAEVVFNLPIDKPFLYRIPDDIRGQLQAGQRVQVPFGRGNQTQVGYCVGLTRPPATWSPADWARLKLLTSVVDEFPLLTPRMLELTRWIGEHYLYWLGPGAGDGHSSGGQESVGDADGDADSTRRDRAGAAAQFEADGQASGGVRLSQSGHGSRADG